MRLGGQGAPLTGAARWVERTVWGAVVLVAVLVVGGGLWLTVYVEPTADALAEARVGTRMITAASMVLVAAVGLGWWRGAPLWALPAVLCVPVACGGLTWVASATLFPQLVYLAAGPLAVCGAVGGWADRWRRPCTWPGITPVEE